MSAAGIRLAIALARVPVTAPALASLANQAEQRGAELVAEWVDADPGLAFCPSVLPRFGWSLAGGDRRS